MYEFGVDCFTRHEGLIENTTIFVRYDGKPVVNSSVCQYYAFELAEDTSGSHKMCVKPLYFIDPDCDVQLDIKSSYSGSSLHTIDCNTETNDDFCADENKDDLYIFIKKHGVIASTIASFLLQVYVEEVDRI
ncbi:uncharacterized protein LOC128160825 [Crassostrea angulata]|uniref:uncharacterized protein LOC128160825 n=1 Tax=Magallana angulata TaxID=2784310 RepID=UPI0022B0F206|nr:uncharacterized protein LOC128160825 [Crassostrea angulata]